MHVRVNGVQLFFDVEGAKLVPDGPAMREKPTLLLLHGGPGFDHSIYRPAYSALADIAQVIFLDHRGNGRSQDGPSEAWNLAQWGDDVRAFCDVLGIVDPIVLGVSFGGMVALAYATRHPAHPSKLVLISTEAAGGTHRERRIQLFERFSGPEVGALARAADSSRFRGTRTRPRSMRGDDWPFRSTRALHAIQTWHAVRSAGPRCCNGLRNPAAKATRSTCSRILAASSVRPSCSAERTIRCSLSSARRISQPRCPRISFALNGLQIAGTP
jgi:pimeloyl-ACP methyl ester carboxylesterase